jgi:hypothetical protein
MGSHASMNLTSVNVRWALNEVSHRLKRFYEPDFIIDVYSKEVSK